MFTLLDLLAVVPSVVPALGKRDGARRRLMVWLHAPSGGPVHMMPRQRLWLACRPPPPVPLPPTPGKFQHDHTPHSAAREHAAAGPARCHLIISTHSRCGVAALAVVPASHACISNQKLACSPLAVNVHVVTPGRKLVLRNVLKAMKIPGVVVDSTPTTSSPVAVLAPVQAQRPCAWGQPSGCQHASLAQGQARGSQQPSGREWGACRADVEQASACVSQGARGGSMGQASRVRTQEGLGSALGFGA